MFGALQGTVGESTFTDLRMSPIDKLPVVQCSSKCLVRERFQRVGG
jgi:hypothetical protein